MATMGHASLSFKFWDEAYFTSVYLINRLPSSIHFEKSSFEILFSQKKLDYAQFHVFRCLCYAFFRPHNDHKLQPKSMT